MRRYEAQVAVDALRKAANATKKYGETAVRNFEKGKGNFGPGT
jgi:hypothetical protein